MRAFARTDRGKIRSANQDTLFATALSIGVLDNLFMVADGMGGQKAGDYASRAVINDICGQLAKQDPEAECKDVIDTLSGLLETSNRNLYRDSLAASDRSGMGTTLVMATIHQGILYAANIGDSRLYLIRDGQLRQVTRDHSYVEEMVQTGRMERNSEEYRSKKNIITRAMGIGEQVEADFFREPLAEGDLFLLCSDGLTNMVPEQDILRLCTEDRTLKDRVNALIDLANANGGRDNISVILGDLGRRKGGLG